MPGSILTGITRTVLVSSEHRTTARPPPNLQLAGTRQNTFDAHLGFSAQRNGKFGRTRLIALRPMARKAPACLSLLSIGVLPVSLVLSRLSPLLFLCAVCVSSPALSQVHSRCDWQRRSTRPSGRRFEAEHARARDRPTDRPTGRPAGRPTDRTTTGRSAGRIAYALSRVCLKHPRGFPARPPHASCRTRKSVLH